jgi:hypothetical protein
MLAQDARKRGSWGSRRAKNLAWTQGELGIVPPTTARQCETSDERKHKKAEQNQQGRTPESPPGHSMSLRRVRAKHTPYTAILGSSAISGATGWRQGGAFAQIWRKF